MIEVYDENGDREPTRIFWNGIEIKPTKLRWTLPARSMLIRGDIFTVLPHLDCSEMDDQ